jgi:hypothetical protein
LLPTGKTLFNNQVVLCLFHLERFDELPYGWMMTIKTAIQQIRDASLPVRY